jgi:hypothetical protein
MPTLSAIRSSVRDVSDFQSMSIAAQPRNRCRRQLPFAYAAKIGLGDFESRIPKKGLTAVRQICL